MAALEPTRTIGPEKRFVSTGEQAQARLTGMLEPPHEREDQVTLKVTREELQILLDSVAFVKTHCGDLDAFYEHVNETDGMARNTVHVDTSSVALPANLFDKTNARSSTSSTLRSLLPSSLPTVSSSLSSSKPNNSLTILRSEAYYPAPFASRPDASAYGSLSLYGLRCDTLDAPHLSPTDPAEVPDEEPLDDIDPFRMRSIPLSLLALKFSRMTGSHESAHHPNGEEDGKEEASPPLACFVLPPPNAGFLLPGRADVSPVHGARQASSTTPAETAIPFGLGFSASNANSRRRQKSRKRSKSLCLPHTSFAPTSTFSPLKRRRPLGDSPTLNQGSLANANPVPATTKCESGC